MPPEGKRAAIWLRYSASKLRYACPEGPRARVGGPEGPRYSGEGPARSEARAPPGIKLPPSGDRNNAILQRGCGTPHPSDDLGECSEPSAEALRLDRRPVAHQGSWRRASNASPFSG